MKYETLFPIILMHLDNISRELTEETTAIRFVVTEQHFEDDVPGVTCRGCKKVVPFFDVLRLRSNDRGTGLALYPIEHCVTCRPRTPVRVLLLRVMPVQLETVRGDDGSPLRWFEKKKRRWKAVANLQFRFMNKSKRPLKLALQPYDDRHHAHDGTPYD